MNSININGNMVVTGGRSITISNGKVIVDGIDITPESKIITIEVKGNIDSITADQCSSIFIHGSSGSIKTMSGDVEVKGDIDGSISTMSGDVDCGAVSGGIKTMSGDIKHR